MIWGIDWSLRVVSFGIHEKTLMFRPGEWLAYKMQEARGRIRHAGSKKAHPACSLGERYELRWQGRAATA